MKLLVSDEEEEDQAAGDSAVTEREAIANELFEGGEDAGEVLIAEHFSIANLKSMNTHKKNWGTLLHFEGEQIRSEMSRQETLAEAFSLALFTI